MINLNKYRNKKTVIDSITFDSRKEARRYCELKLMEKAGEISGLELQKKFVLIPEQREFTMEIYKSGRNKGCFKKGKLLERECCYIADFYYLDKDGKLVVEDVKGVRTEAYKIKRKLMLERYGIRVVEI